MSSNNYFKIEEGDIEELEELTKQSGDSWVVPVCNECAALLKNDDYLDTRHPIISSNNYCKLCAPHMKGFPNDKNV